MSSRKSVWGGWVGRVRRRYGDGTYWGRGFHRFWIGHCEVHPTVPPHLICQKPTHLQDLIFRIAFHLHRFPSPFHLHHLSSWFMCGLVHFSPLPPSTRSTSIREGVDGDSDKESKDEREEERRQGEVERDGRGGEERSGAGKRKQVCGAGETEKGRGGARD